MMNETICRVDGAVPGNEAASALISAMRHRMCDEGGSADMRGGIKLQAAPASLCRKGIRRSTATRTQVWRPRADNRILAGRNGG
ncbi:hypothetical protein GCM10025771_30930 [Niveibacterium umoris]